MSVLLLCSLLGSPLYGSDDAQMTTAAAQDTGEGLLDLCDSGVRILIQQRLGVHKDSIHTEAALRRLLLDKGLL
jgi:hypothetical protein